MVLVTLIVSCQGFEFVYDKSPTIKLLENNAQVIISGDDISIIKSQLNNFVGTSTSSAGFILLVSSSKISNNVVIKDNQTVSQIEINHILNYSLQKKDGVCVITEAKISTVSTYNLKSSGYSFGTDLAEKELSTKNLHSNIDQFLNELSINYNYLKCKE